jgi:hypothetical protein
LNFLFQYQNAAGGTEWIAIAFALMESKSRAAYESVFQAMLNKWVKLGCSLQFTKFLSDFERGEMDAISTVFGHEKVALLNISSPIQSY